MEFNVDVNPVLAVGITEQQEWLLRDHHLFLWFVVHDLVLLDSWNLVSDLFDVAVCFGPVLIENEKGCIAIHFTL